ncbi:MAG: hypothetical protein DRP45_06030 [Candidatus Zixiibacteriota bacterium]|nr:MAG: hypothetical protein DRP45_06030 [candidate division Zixibacteria bacterium]
MFLVSADWFVCLFFLLALVVVARLKKQLCVHGNSSYNNISGGLALLCLVSLGRLYWGLGMFEAMPFLSETVFYDLLSWIGIITGATFLVSGASSWLPIARKHHAYSKDSVRRLELLRKVEQLVGVETRLDTIFATSLEYMVEHFQLSAAAVFKYSSRHKHLVLEATAGAATEQSAVLASAKLSLDDIRSCDLGMWAETSMFSNDPVSKLGRPRQVCPITVGKRSVGCFVFWADKNTFGESDDRLTMQLAIDVIAHKINDDRMALRLEWMTSTETLRRRMEQSVDSDQSSRDIFRTLVKEITGTMPVDFCSLTMTTNRGRSALSYSCGKNGQVLVVKSPRMPGESTLTGTVLRNGIRYELGDVHSDNPSIATDIHYDGSIGSLVAQPILVDGHVRGVLILAAEAKQAYSENDLSCLDNLLSALSRFVHRELTICLIDRHVQQIDKLGKFFTSIGEFENPGQVFAEAARLIAEETSADIVRITTVDDKGLFLKSRALVCAQPYEAWVPGDGEMILSLMPLHREAISSREHLLTTSNDTESAISDIEARQMFAPGASASLIVPVSGESGTRAIISVGDMSGRDCLLSEESTITFVGAVANILGGVIELSVARQAAWRWVSTGAQDASSGTALNNRLKSSVTGILGSVDLIKAHWASSGDRQLGKYIAMLDRSARKMDTAVRESSE